MKPLTRCHARRITARAIYRQMDVLEISSDEVCAKTGMSRGHFYNVVTGSSLSAPARLRIEGLLGAKFWSEEPISDPHTNTLAALAVVLNH